MKSYTTLLFDADGTLLDFKKAQSQALCAVLKMHGISPDDAILQKYAEINDSLWKAYEKGEILRSQIGSTRFKQLFKWAGLDYCEEMGIEADYRRELAREHDLLENAFEVCKALYRKYSMYIITNGNTHTQIPRLAQCGLAPFFKKNFISEEMGCRKPERQYFDAVLEDIGCKKSDALIIGDSLSSDILGGINAGIDTCWFNPDSRPAPEDCRPTMEIKSLLKLLDILLFGGTYEEMV